MTAARRRLHDAALSLFAQRGSSEVSVSELAAAAGIARGTVYNNIDSLDDFFEDVSRDLALEMRHRMLASFPGVRDPAQRLADGQRFFVRRAHEEPGWGRFVARFGTVDPTVQALWAGPSMDDVRSGIRHGRFSLRPELEFGAMALVNGTTITAMWTVLNGHATWRDVGSSTAELVLRALGLDPDEACRLATRALPELAALPDGQPSPVSAGDGDSPPHSATSPSHPTTPSTPVRADRRTPAKETP